MAEGLLYGWGGTEWVKVKCDSSGNLLVDASELTFDVLKLNPQAVAPTAVAGGLYVSSVDNALYVGEP